MKTIIIALTLAGVIALTGTTLYAGDAKETFESKCASCHGKDGKGDTKMGKKLEVRDFSDPKVQAELKDEEMIKAIKEGVKNKDGKTTMKAFGDKLSDDEIKALVTYVRSLKK